MTQRLSAFFRSLRRAKSGVSMVEFAISLPILVSLGMYGTELAYMALVRLQVSELALSVADNAARLGQTDNGSVTPTVSEDQVDSVMTGALRQGESIDFEQNGRVILSSLEYDAATERQYIHWQRCSGELGRESDYGNDTTKNGLVGDEITALGQPGRTVTAPPNSAVMFVEVFYRYDGLFGTMFTDRPVFKQEAAFIVRDDRNLAPGVTGTGGNSSCS